MNLLVTNSLFDIQSSAEKIKRIESHVPHQCVIFLRLFGIHMSSKEKHLKTANKTPQKINCGPFVTTCHHHLNFKNVSMMNVLA